MALWSKLKWWVKITPALIFGESLVYREDAMDSGDDEVTVSALMYRGNLYITGINYGDSKDV
jgi:hypothetical protein